MNIIKHNLVFAIIILSLYLTKTKKICGIDTWYKNKKIFKHSEKDEGSKHLLDYYSFTHITHGIILYNIFYYLTGNIEDSIKYSMLSEIAYEIIGNTEYIVNRFRRFKRSKDYSGDSVVNRIGDLWMCYIGILFSIFFNIKYQIGYVILSELILFYIMKDNMFNNVFKILSWKVY